MSRILTLNAGSSSIKFSVYSAGEAPQELAVGQVEKLGSDSARLKLRWHGADQASSIGAADHSGGVAAILGALAPVLDGAAVVGIGHRIVHGGPKHDAPEVLTGAVLDELSELEPFAPLHQPHNLSAVRAAMTAFPDAVQVGCFDTAFHRGHPFVNDAFALPRRYYDKGVRRYGFHGLSYDYIVGELSRIDPAAAHGRTIVAHLGNGASMCAIRDGKSVESTMGFSALDGLPMGTRTGQIDPGVLLYLMDQEAMDAAALTKLLYTESGLKGLSGLSNDMRTLEEADTVEARQAIDYFTHRIQKELGGLAAVLGGLDTLVFTGGIGEHSVATRAAVCDGMGWMGVALDANANSASAPVISSGPVTIRVIPTDEELVIARAVNAKL